MDKRKQIASLLGAGALVVAFAGTALAADATPVGWYASSGGDGSNDGDFWVAYLNDNFDAGLEEGDCDTKLQDAALDAVSNGDGSADLGVAYGWVIVKQGAPNPGIIYDNTIFQDVAADETVFADTNGNGIHDEGDSGGISHIIVCVPGETTTTTTTEVTTTTTEETTTTTTTTFTGGTGGETDIPTEPNTAAVETGGPSTPANSAWLLVVALGVLLGSVVILTPAGAKAKR